MTLTAAPELETAAVAVARSAADLVREAVGHGAALRTKSSSTDVVTPTDLRSEELIRNELERLVPGSSFVGEELPEHDAGGEVEWVIDPIDGTVNFLYDLPVVAVSIGARVAGAVVAGAVVDVLRRETYSAALGQGARRDGAPVRVNAVADLSEALVATGYSYRATVREQQAVVASRVLPRARDVRSMGSAALQLCWVGCGRIDAYYERDIKPWDGAAGLLIAREAGATAEDPDDSNDDLTVAAAPGIFDALRSLL